MFNAGIIVKMHWLAQHYTTLVSKTYLTWLNRNVYRLCCLPRERVCRRVSSVRLQYSSQLHQHSIPSTTQSQHVTNQHQLQSRQSTQWLSRTDCAYVPLKIYSVTHSLHLAFKVCLCHKPIVITVAKHTRDNLMNYVDEDSGRTWNPITSPWMKQLTWLRNVHLHARNEWIN